MTSIHQFKAEGIAGDTIDFADFKGKKLIVVNVASECGYTPQYQQLQELYDNFKDTLTIVGFPSNDFGGQEPGTNEEIQAFCSRHFAVRFPMAAKVRIKGNEPHPIYEWPFLPYSQHRQLGKENLKRHLHSIPVDRQHSLK